MYQQPDLFDQQGDSYPEEPEDYNASYDFAEDYEEAPHYGFSKKHTIFRPRLGKPNFVLSVLVTSIRIFALVGILGGLAAVGAVLGIAKAYVETAPNLDLTLLGEQDKTSFIYDGTGKIITDYKGTENRVMVGIGQMPETLQHAFIAVEDARFSTHNGVDLKRILGSFVQNLSSDTQQGGSTITQQLIKQTVLSSELSYKRKIQEAYLAMQLETQYTKAQILECYLNTIYLGENYYGVEVAAKGYFGKELSQLSLRECAMLAGLTRNPYYYNPRRNFYTRQSEETDYHKITNNRTDYVLRCMYENEFITHQQYQDALVKETAAVLEHSTTEGEGMYEYAHYVEYAVRDVVSCFLQLNNLEDNTENRYKMEGQLRTGGYHVTLAIDTEIQTIVENTLESWANYPALRDPSDRVYRPRNSDGSYAEIVQPQAAAVVLDYRSGELKAIVGGRTKPTQRKTLNRATDMKMPVGSAIKPISVFAPAVDMGGSPASIVYNMPIPIKSWRGSDGKDTWPQNYGGGGYVGPETLREAMKRSHNVGAAQTLMTMVGLERSVDYLLQMGVRRDHIDATPFGLSLGSSGISPVEMAVAYGVLGNRGVYQQPISFLSIWDSNQQLVYDSHAQRERRQVFRPSTAWMTVDMMKDVVSGGTGTRAKIKGQTVAGKTGTNSDQRGVFFSGLTGWYSSALWIGHDNYKPLSSKSTGSTNAAALWQEYMKKVHDAKSLSDRDIVEGQPQEYGLVRVTTCGVSGQLATDACRNDYRGYGTVTDYWQENMAPTTQCQMHRVMTICTQSNMLATEWCPAELRAARGVVSIPSGHPLSAFVNTQYAAVIAEYLGDFAALSGGGYVESCPIHGYGYTGEPQYGEPAEPAVENSLLSDARQLLQSAYGMLNALDSSGIPADALRAAVFNMEAVLAEPNPGFSTVAESMGQLTQAMFGTQ